jgi:plastocyanin
MKLDLTKMPVAQGIILFLLVATGIGFYGAFMATDDDGEAVDGNGSPTATPADGNGTPTGDQIAISMGDNFFDPTDFSVGAGQTVTFNITNDGAVIHNMHVSVGGEFTGNPCDGSADPCSDPNILPGGSTATLDFTAPDAPGEVPFRCDFHPVEMTGVITVQ